MFCDLFSSQTHVLTFGVFNFVTQLAANKHTTSHKTSDHVCYNAQPQPGTACCSKVSESTIVDVANS